MSSFSQRALLVTCVIALFTVAAGCAEERLSEDANTTPSLAEPSPNQLARLPAYEYHLFSWCPTQSVTASIPLSEEPGVATVYALDHATADVAFVAEIAAALGIRAEPQFLDQEGFRHFIAEDDSGTLGVLETNRFIYFERNVAPNVEPQNGSVSDTEAKKAAEDFLRQLGLLPEADLSATVERDDEIIVHFQLAGVVIAPEVQPFIKVEIAPNGDVLGLDYQWQEPHPVGDYPIVSEAEALDRLRSCAAYVRVFGPMTEVLEVEFVYLPRPDGWFHEYLIPAYSFRNEGEDGSVNELGVVPAVSSEYLPVKSFPDAPPQP
jgi:hypothetical protein